MAGKDTMSGRGNLGSLWVVDKIGEGKVLKMLQIIYQGINEN
jgi:hypothetical protein